MSNLTVIFVSFRSAEIILSAIESVSQHQIIVVDNASGDNTIELIKTNFPKVTIISNSNNIGFGRANNLALQQVKTPYALALNPDARISAPNIDRCLKIMQQHQQIALAGPMVYNVELIDGNFVEKGICGKVNKNMHLFEQQEYYANQFITGAGMFFNMSIMQNIGFFDQGFFLYCEDNEICKRVVKKGYQTAIIKDTKLLHLGSKSAKITQAEINRTYWHRFGWSKLYYTQLIWGRSVAILKGFRMLIKFLFLCLKKQPKTADKQALKGVIFYLCGKKAFDNNNNPRG
jgi:hypothetical protein